MAIVESRNAHNNADMNLQECTASDHAWPLATTCNKAACFAQRAGEWAEVAVSAENNFSMSQQPAAELSVQHKRIKMFDLKE